MKLVKSKLQQIIREEIQEILNEGDFTKSFKKASNWDKMTGETGTEVGQGVGGAHKLAKRAGQAGLDALGLRQKRDLGGTDLEKSYKYQDARKTKYKLAPCKACINKCKHETSCGKPGNLFRNCKVCATQCKEMGHCGPKKKKPRGLRPSQRAADILSGDIPSEEAEDILSKTSSTT
jgi:hypothetical protein